VCVNHYLVQSEITDELTDLLENETNPILFSCQAIGEPVPTISWYYNGSMINVSDTSKYNVSSSVNGTVVMSSLTIMNTQSSDVGTYTCHAENIIGIDRSSGILTVNGKCNTFMFINLLSICISVCLYNVDLFYLHINNFSDAAEILEPPGGETKYIKEGENITFRCIGVGHPPPLVQWRKLNGSLSDRVSTTNISMSTNKGNVTRVTVDIILTRVYREDTGVYECSASNLLNIVTRSINLVFQRMYVCT